MCIRDRNKDVNENYLFYAASSAVNSKDYSLALEYYEELRDIRYEGIETKFFITDVSSGNEIEINSETEFNLLKKGLKTYLLAGHLFHGEYQCQKTPNMSSMFG